MDHPTAQSAIRELLEPMLKLSGADRADVERARRCAALLGAALLKIAGAAADAQPDDLAPTRWFSRNTQVTCWNLSKCPDAQVGRVRRPGRQHLFSRQAVRRRFPHLWVHPENGRPPA